MPSESAVLVRLPSYLTSTRAMKRFSNSCTASSNRTPLSTLSPQSFSSRSLITARGAPSPPALARAFARAAGAHHGCRSSCELPAGEAAIRFDVLLARLFDDVRRQRRDGGLFVPADPLEVVAHELLVEAGLRAARLVAVDGPEAGRVGRQRLVDQDHALLGRLRAAGAQPEFEFRVGDDDAARFGVGRAFGVQPERQVADAIEERPADHLHGPRFADVDVVPALLLGGRREDRVGKAI